MGEQEQAMTDRRTAALLGRRRTCRGPGDGYTMIGLLMVLVILAILAAIAMSRLSGLPSSTTPSIGAHGSTASTSSLGSLPDTAAIAACEADFRAIEVGMAAYRAINGSLPPPGTAWSQESSLGIRYLLAWPSNPRFSFTWDGTELSVVPVHGIVSQGSAGSSSPPTGCFAG